ncbi:MAG: TMEM175 family protein [Oligoflexia bacterium]|nr:TMEM175 family protein [Oligoflexia bacterium]
MGKGRLEAFSDGVIAIIITIMVLDLKTPQATGLAALAELLPVFLSYVLSFIYVGIYWNNHHHLLHTCKHVTGRILWANLHLLFWLSLIPFSTRWLGERRFTGVPVAAYGGVLLMSALAWLILQCAIIAANEGGESILQKAIGHDWKGKVSCVCYLAAILISPWVHWVSLGLYVIVALIWLSPDKRIEEITAAAAEPRS